MHLKHTYRTHAYPIILMDPIFNFIFRGFLLLYKIRLCACETLCPQRYTCWYNFYRIWHGVAYKLLAL